MTRDLGDMSFLSKDFKEHSIRYEYVSKLPQTKLKCGHLVVRLVLIFVNMHLFMDSSTSYYQKLRTQYALDCVSNNFTDSEPDLYRGSSTLNVLEITEK